MKLISKYHSGYAVPLKFFFEYGFQLENDKTP